MGREVKREEVDYTIFTDPVEQYLAEIRGGCPGGEAQALERTIRAYPGVTANDVRAWARDPDFRRVLKHAREMGEENRRWDQQQAARAPGDPWATPPRPGSPDFAAERYTPDAPGGMGGWLRRLWQRMTVEAARAPEPPAPHGARFIPESELTEAQWQAIGQQAAWERARLERERAQQAAGFDGPMSADGSRWRTGGQTWDREREPMSPDGSLWNHQP